MTFKTLLAAATELKEFLGFEIDLDVKEPELLEQVKEAIEALTPEDKLTKPTQAVIDEITGKTPAKKEVAEKPAAKMKIVEADSEEEVEEEKQPVKKPTAKKAVMPAKKETLTKKEVAEKPAKKEKKEKGPGVIATIVKCVEKAGKKGISKEDILEVLTETFPDKNPDSMKNTINVQVPARITKERFAVEKTKDGLYRKA
jgi:DNA-binding transcriptional regulator YhcF (GntR family)